MRLAAAITVGLMNHPDYYVDKGNIYCDHSDCDWQRPDVPGVSAADVFTVHQAEQTAQTVAAILPTAYVLSQCSDVIRPVKHPSFWSDLFRFTVKHG